MGDLSLRKSAFGESIQPMGIMLIHLWHYLVSVGKYAITLGGTSTAGFFGILILPPLISGFQSVRANVNNGSTWIDAVEQMRPISLFKKPVVVVWLFLVAWSIAAVTYRDHQYLVVANSTHVRQLRTAIALKPRWDARIYETMVADNAREQTVLVLITIFINHGPPSILLVNKTWIEFANGKTIYPRIVLRGHGDARLFGAHGNPNITLAPSDYFPDKALDHPIPQGGDVVGWNMFVVPGVSRKELLDPRTQVFFQCLDADNRAITAHSFVSPHRQ